MLWQRPFWRIGIFEPDGSGYRVVGPTVTDRDEPVWSPDGRSLVITDRSVKKTWSVDLATGESIETQTPVDSWLHLAP